MNIIRSFAFVLLACLATSHIAIAHGDRTIYYNGKIFTGNPRNPWAEGVVVEGRLINAVGTNQQVLALKRKGTVLVDLLGKTLVPGFNDAHAHPFDTTSFPRAVHLNSAAEFVPGPGPSLEAIISLVKQGAATHPPGTWLMASVGTRFIENPAANRFAFQDVSPHHPVLLASWFGHGTYLNTKAMQVIGIGEQEPDPFGGFYERVPGSNVITGIAHEYAEHLIRRYFASQMTDAEFITLYERFARDAAAMGYTSVQEFSVGVPQRRHLNLLARSELPIKWRAICFPFALDESCDEQLPLQRKPSAHLTASGIKWIADGTFIERLSFLSKDYADAPGVRGQLNFPADAIQSQLKRSVVGKPVDAQPMFHAVGDATADTILDRMSVLAEDRDWRVRRPRIEHGTLLRADRYVDARRKGVIVVQNPLHFSLAPITDVRFPPALLAEIDPMRSLLDANVTVAIGSDAVAGPGNPFLDLFFALLQPTRPAEALTMEQAVVAYTRTSAEAEFQEQRKGTIEPGKAADLTLLSQDIFTVPLEAIPATRALLTIVDGAVVHDARANAFR